METNDAVKLLNDLASVANLVKSLTTSNLELRAKCQGLEEQKKKLIDEAKEMRPYVNKFKKLAMASDVEICKQCGGDGGFVYDMGEHGCEGEECTNCGASGITKK